MYDYHSGNNPSYWVENYKLLYSSIMLAIDESLK